MTFIAKRIFFGSRDEKLNPDPSQWRNYGLNWDRTCTTSMGMAGMGGAPSLACKKPPTSSGSPLTTLGTPGYFDGNDCRDNAFGGTLIPLLTFFQSSPEVGLDAETAEGGPTFVLRISDLVDATKNGDDTYAPGELFFTLNRDTFRTGPNLTPGPVDFEASPAQLRTMDASSAAYRYKPAGGVEKIADWDPTGAGPKLEPTDMYVGMTSRVRFPKAYVRNHVWISGDLAASETSALVPLGGYVAEVKAAASVAVIELDPTDHRKAPKRAQIATVVDGQSFTDALTSPQSPLLKCGPSKNTPKELVATIIRESADLKAGASDFRDNAQFCDLLSLGAGVEWVPTRIADFPAGVPPFKFGCAEPGGYPIRIPLDGSGGAGGASGAGGAAGAGGSAGASGGSAGNGGASAGNAGKAGAGG